MCSRDTDPSISSCAIHSTRCQTGVFWGFQKVVKGYDHPQHIHTLETLLPLNTINKQKNTTYKHRILNMNYSKRLIHQVVPLHFGPTFFLLESRSQSHWPFSHPTAIPCHPRSSSGHLDRWGDHIPQWKNNGFASPLVAEVSGFSWSFCPPGWGTLWSSSF